DEVLQQGVRGITDLMVMPGLINLDFADVRSVMQEMGKAMMGTGEASGDNRALEAAQKAIANPLLDGVSMQGAKGVIISITGGDDMRLLEVDEAANHIRDLVDPDANIIWGSAFNPELEGRIRVSVVATGIDSDVKPGAPAPAPEAARSFSFGTARKTDDSTSFRPSTAATAPEPAAPAPSVSFSAPPAAEPAPLDLHASDAMKADAQPETADAADDELVLGAETIVPQPPKTYAEEPFGAAPAAPRAPAPAPDAGRRPWIAPGSEAAAPDAAPQPRVKLGGTLFERMSNAARGPARDEGTGEAKDPIDIPRFLHRQNNQ
ncbi:MAG: cell division protein FtsZ, partial [Sphingomonas sp.]